MIPQELQSNTRRKETFNPPPHQKKEKWEIVIIVCLFSSRCSACREVYKWICFPGDGCVAAAICTVLTVTVFLCMDHFIYWICRVSCSAGPDIIALPYLAGQHLSLAQLSVCVQLCWCHRLLQLPSSWAQQLSSADWSEVNSCRVSGKLFSPFF